MTNSQTLLFIGKCLTLRHYPDRIGEIRDTIITGSVKWEQVVWMSTGQLVFPALYLQQTRAGLLPELPHDLVEYMKEMTDLNRERNRQIIDQAKEITAILNEQAIYPTFLKGTAHLLDGLYEDIAERMVGDIDLLVPEQEMQRTVEILIGAGYDNSDDLDPIINSGHRHHPRLIHGHRIAGVEVHRQVVVSPYDKVFDGERILKARKPVKTLDGAFVLSDEHQIIHNILNVQVNDKASWYGRIYLRQKYDLLLLSERKNPLTAVENFVHLFNLLNTNLAVTSKILGNPACITYRHSIHARYFMRRIQRHLTFPRWAHFTHVGLYLLLRFSGQLTLLVQSVYNKNARKSLFARLGDPEWYKAHWKSYKISENEHLIV